MSKGWRFDSSNFSCLKFDCDKSQFGYSMRETLLRKLTILQIVARLDAVNCSGKTHTEHRQRNTTQHTVSRLFQNLWVCLAFLWKIVHRLVSCPRQIVS